MIPMTPGPKNAKEFWMLQSHSSRPSFWRPPESPATATAYLIHMKAYMEGIKKLFPHYRFHANHHMALHLYDSLCRFGPVHGWWTFPFERLIGMLERIPTNFKIGMLTVFIPPLTCLINVHFSSRSTRTDDFREFHLGGKPLSFRVQGELMPTCHSQVPIYFLSTYRPSYPQ